MEKNIFQCTETNNFIWAMEIVLLHPLLNVLWLLGVGSDNRIKVQTFPTWITEPRKRPLSAQGRFAGELQSTLNCWQKDGRVPLITMSGICLSFYTYTLHMFSMWCSVITSFIYHISLKAANTSENCRKVSKITRNPGVGGGGRVTSEAWLLKEKGRKKERKGELSHFLHRKSVFTLSRRGNDRMDLQRALRKFSHFSLPLTIIMSTAANTHAHTHRAREREGEEAGEIVGHTWTIHQYYY